MGQVKNEIANAIKTLNLGSDLIELLDDKTGFEIFQKCLDRFVNSGDRKRWWEDFKNISFSVTEGNAFAITGKNGSGKSTLVKILCGVLSPTKGSVSLSVNEQTVEYPDYYPHIGLVSPYLNMYEDFSAEENLQFIKKIIRTSICWFLRFLARSKIKRLGLFVIGITGSIGKTSTKEAFPTFFRRNFFEKFMLSYT